MWDIPAADDIITLSPEWLKVPSACNLDFDLLEHIVRRFRGDIHVSLGMTTRTETEAVVRHLDTLGALPRTVLYACTSNYPVEHADVCLSEIAWLRERYGRAIKAVGFSGHHHGIALDMAAVALGAEYIERHFTLNRTWRGTDHAASLEPGGFRRLIRDVGAVSAGMGRKPADGLLACEQDQREKLKRGGIPCHA